MMRIGIGNIFGIQGLGAFAGAMGAPAISVPNSMAMAAGPSDASTFTPPPFATGNGTNGVKNPGTILSRWVDEIGLPSKIARILFRERIATARSLVMTTKESLLEMEGLTSEMLVETQKALARHRLTLKMNLEGITTPERTPAEVAAVRGKLREPADVKDLFQQLRSALNLPVGRLNGVLPEDVEFLRALEIRFVGDLVQRSVFELNTARLESKPEKDQRLSRLQTALAELELQLEMPLIGFQPPKDFENILDQPTEVLRLNRRLRRCLEDNGIRLVRQLPSIFEELKPGEKKLRGLRREDIQTVREALAVWGIRV